MPSPVCSALAPPLYPSDFTSSRASSHILVFPHQHHRASIRIGGGGGGETCQLPGRAAFSRDVHQHETMGSRPSHQLFNSILFLLVFWPYTCLSCDVENRRNSHHGHNTASYNQARPHLTQNRNS